MACGVAATIGLIYVMGKILTSCCVNILNIAREVIKNICYYSSESIFDANTCGALMMYINSQALDTTRGFKV